jgi:hypothetical protein
MGRGLGDYIGLIAVGSGAFVLLLSYLGAYLIGRSHGRRDEQRSSHHIEQADATQRIAAVESSIYGLSGSIDRLMDAQRLLVAQQDHLSRKVGLTDRNNQNNAIALPAVQGHKTPS